MTNVPSAHETSISGLRGYAEGGLATSIQLTVGYDSKTLVAAEAHEYVPPEYATYWIEVIIRDGPMAGWGFDVKVSIGGCSYFVAEIVPFLSHELYRNMISLQRDSLQIPCCRSCCAYWSRTRAKALNRRWRQHDEGSSCAGWVITPGVRYYGILSSLPIHDWSHRQSPQ